MGWTMLPAPIISCARETAKGVVLSIHFTSICKHPDQMVLKCRYMANEGFIEATPVQEGCWPLIRDGGDLIGVAEPGSGKTLAFLLPAAIKIASWVSVLDFWGYKALVLYAIIALGQRKQSTGSEVVENIVTLDLSTRFFLKVLPLNQVINPNVMVVGLAKFPH